MSLAMKYGMMKRGKKTGAACDAHGAVGCMACGGKMAEGGFVGEEEESGYQPFPKPAEAAEDEGEEGLVDRIMQRFAKGGAVANDTPPVADFEDNDFDVLPGMDDTEADYTGENSGDDVGDKAEDEDEKDVVSRAMKSWKKKDRLPRPA